VPVFVWRVPVPYRDGRFVREVREGKKPAFSDGFRASLGFGAAVWERLAEDWRGPGASSFVLAAEHLFAKQPDNMVDVNSYAVWEKAQRATGAYRTGWLGRQDSNLGMAESKSPKG
jgi:hypothetical protein